MAPILAAIRGRKIWGVRCGLYIYRTAVDEWGFTLYITDDPIYRALVTVPSNETSIGSPVQGVRP